MCSACSDYLDIVPDDGMPTLENAFAMRSEAERYLATCYSYMPHDGQLDADPALLGGDEIWSGINLQTPFYDDRMFGIARGLQNTYDPIGGEWWRYCYQGIRVCNTFLENINSVPDMKEDEKRQWAAEATFLKAYFHFYLVRMYGPIPIVRENLSIDATPAEVKVSRDPVDECFDYIIELLNKALPGLPPKIESSEKFGRITQPICAALKAKVWVTAASPLFNGNNDQKTLANRNGVKLFNPDVVAAKWDSARVACRDAIRLCENPNLEIALYQYKTTAELSDEIKQQMTIRNTFTERWNSEVIWANTQTLFAANNLLQEAAALIWDISMTVPLQSRLQPPLKIAEMYYTKHGVPIEEDKEWRGLDPYSLRVGDDSHLYYIKKDYTTIQLHFDREPRFYAALGFDGGIWYGQGRTTDPASYFYIACRLGGAHQKNDVSRGPFTGYYAKKYVHYQLIQNGVYNLSKYNYQWPIIRLSDLYLLYAEAINEAEGPDGPNSADLFKYMDLVRQKNGLEGVKESWNAYAVNSDKYKTQAGMQQIIHRERLIELALEGQRFWDLRRWKEAPDEYTKSILSWTLMERDPARFYKPTELFQQAFSIRDYFFPIQTSVIENNPNLVQNIGW
jgi:hypothetical protein